MPKRVSVELSMSHVCEACGNSNVITLAKLTTNPTCEHCDRTLRITDEEILIAKAMYIHSVAAGEVIDIS